MVTLYSQGYRFDYKTIAIRKVGGVFVRSEPTDAFIFLDGKQIKNQSWLLQNGTLISNLIPDTYTLELKKDGYRPWRKLVTIEPSLVTEADAIMLIPDTAPISFDSNVISVRISGTNVIEQKSDGSLRINNEKHMATGTLLAVSPDQKSGLFLNSKGSLHFIRDLEAGSSILNISLLFNNLLERILQVSEKATIAYIAYHPNDSQKLFVGTKKAVYLMDKEKLTLALLEGGGVHYFKVTNNGFFWVNDKNELRRYDYKNRERETVMTDVGDIKDIEVLSNSSEIGFAILKKDGSLWLFNPNLTEKSEAADQAKLFVFSPDNQKIVFIDRDGKINIQSLVKKEKKASFILPIEGEIDSLLWWRDSGHLFIRYTDGKIYFTETDGIMPVNSYLLSENINAYAYDSNRDVLFMLQGTNLLRFSLTKQ